MTTSKYKLNLRSLLSLPYRATRRAVRTLGQSVGLIPYPFFSFTPDTLPALSAALHQVRDGNVAGDYYEFGMAFGYSFWWTQKTAKRLGLCDMRFFGFDSFAGLPAPIGPDAGTDFKQGDYAASWATVTRNLTKHGVDWSRTTLIAGFYDRSLNEGLKQQHGMRKAAVALIDCDLYSSTVPVLNFLNSLLQDGTVLLFDDWNCFGASDSHGERRAFQEFLSCHPQWHAEPLSSFGWHGQSFVMRQRPQ